MFRYRLERPRPPPLDAYTFDSWLDDSVQWRVEEITCGRGHRFVSVYRLDKYVVCPRCVVTDRAVKL